MATLINPSTGSAASGPSGFPSPNLYLGVFSGSNPSASVNGQWWYRVDLNAVYQYVNGQVVPVTSGGPTTVIVGSETIGGVNVVVDQDVIVLPSSTLVTYGSIFFARSLKVLNGGTWLSSNPNASSTASQTNSYTIYEGVYIDGQYVVNPYNYDSLTAPSISYILSPNALVINGTLQLPNGCTLFGFDLTGSGTLYVPSGYSLTLGNTNISVSYIAGSGLLYSVTNNTIQGYVLPSSQTFQIFTSQTITAPPSYNMLIPQFNQVTIGSSMTVTVPYIVGSGTLYVPSGYSVTIQNATLAVGNLASSGTLYIPSGYSVTIQNTNISVSYIAGSGTLVIPSGYSVTIQNTNISVSYIAGSGLLYSVTNNTIQGYVLPSSQTFQLFTSQTITTSPSYNMLITSSATVIAFAALPSDIIVYSPNSLLVSYLSSYPTSSTTDSFSAAEWGKNVGGAGIAIFSITNIIAASASKLELSSVTMAPNSNYAGSQKGYSVTGGLGYTLTAVAGSTTGYYILEIYATVGEYYPYLIYIGTASYTYSLSNVTIGSGTCCDNPSGNYSYPRNGAYSSGTIIISGTMYSG